MEGTPNAFGINYFWFHRILSVMSSVPWRCNECNTTFYPQNDDYRCPKCLSNNTVPIDRKYETASESNKKVPDREVFCPKCETKMVEGYIVEPNSPFSLTTLFANLFWSRHVDGRITSRIFLHTYACPSCGYTETYLADPEQLQKKL